VLVFGNIYDRVGLADSAGLLGRLFAPLAAHFIGVTAVIPHQLETLVGDVLGDGGDEVAGRKDLKVALALGVHAGMPLFSILMTPFPSGAIQLLNTF